MTRMCGPRSLFDEVVALGYDRAYPTFTRQLRARALRPHCEPCASSNGRAHVDIEHPPGEEMQWDWLELDDTPWGAKAYVLVGALSHSGRFRVWFSEADDQAHLVVGIDEILRRLGGTAKRWRVDRMATVISPGTSQVQRSFVPVAKHYGVGVDPCPPRHGNRKGVVEKNIHYLTQRWWRTARVASPAEAQASPIGSAPRSPTPATMPASPSRAGGWRALLALPDVPFPAEVIVVRTVAANALVSLWGNRYSVPPGLVGGHVQIRWRLGAETIELRAAGGRRRDPHARPARRATHRPAPRAHPGVGERRARARSTRTGRVGARSTGRPPTPRLVLAAELLGDRGADPVIDLDIYRRAIDGQDVG